MYILIYETKIDHFKCMTDTSVYDCYVKFSSYVIYITVNNTPSNAYYTVREKAE